MPLCRPTPVQSTALWKTVRESDYCVLQKRTFLWAVSWRLVSKNPCFLIAVADDLLPLEEDWEFVHSTVINSRLEEFSKTGPWLPQGADTSPHKPVVPLLVSYLSVHWVKEFFAHSGGASLQPSRGDGADGASPTSLIPIAEPRAAKEDPLANVPPQPLSPAPRPGPLVRCDREVALSEAKALEAQRREFLRKAEPVLAEARREVRKEHMSRVDQLLEKFGAGMKEELRKTMREEEERAIALHTSVLYSVESAACFKVIDIELQNKKRASELKAKVITIQRYWRGYRARSNYRKLVRGLFQRDKAAHELLDTERAYLASLQLMITHFMNPLKTMTSTANMFIMQPEDLSMMFSNAELLIPVHKELLSQLEERMARWDRRSTEIGDVYLRFAPFLKMYKQYVSSFDRATAVLTRYMDNPDFKRWHNSICETSELKKLRLNAFLIMPVQRIPRYALMLKEMVHSTEHDHPDFKNLSKALEHISQVANDINEAKRRAEGQQRMMELGEALKEPLPNFVQPHRTFVCEATAMLRKQKLENGEEMINQQKPCFIVLLSDMFLVAQRRNPAVSLAEGGMALLDTLPLARGSVFKVSDLVSNNKWKYGFELKTPLKSVVIFMEFEKERDRWFGQITDITEQLKKNIKSLVMSKEALANLQLSDGSASSLNALATKQQAGQRRSVGVCVGSRRESAGIDKKQKLKDVLDTYRDIVGLEAELLSLPIDVKNLLPKLAASLPPDALARLKPRVDLLQDRLKRFDRLNERVTTLVRQYVSGSTSCDVIVMLDKSIMDGLDFISAIKNWLVLTKQQAAAAANQAGTSLAMSTRGEATTAGMTATQSLVVQGGGDLEVQMRYLMSWYINLCQTWEVFTDADVQS